MKKFHRFDLQHLCKITSDGSLAFYQDEDFLVFMSIVSVMARKYNIRVVSLCIMFNHFHIAVYAESEKALNSFYGNICCQFSRAYNSRKDKNKIVFKRRKNSCEKFADKDKRNCYIYIANNPVEKSYCVRAMDYRWNFLSYYGKTWIGPETISSDMALAMAIVRYDLKNSRPLRYGFLELYRSRLSSAEFRILEDYMILNYLEVDYSEIETLFGSFNDFISATRYSTGSDYDIQENNLKENYRHYADLGRIAEMNGFRGGDNLEGKDLYKITRQMAYTTTARNLEISRFLHLDLEKVVDYTGRL